MYKQDWAKNNYITEKIFYLFICQENSTRSSLDIWPQQITSLTQIHIKLSSLHKQKKNSRNINAHKFVWTYDFFQMTLQILSIWKFTLTWQHGYFIKVETLRIIRSWSWHPHEGADCLIKETPKNNLNLLLCEDQQEIGHLWTRKLYLTRHWVCGHLDLKLVSFQTVRNKYMLFKNHQWQFVLAAQKTEIPHDNPIG